MADLIALIVALLAATLVMIKKASPGMAIVAVFAGVALEQLLGKWVLGLLPSGVTAASPYLQVAIQSVLTFTPVVVVLIASKVRRRSAILALLTSLLLGFLVFIFGLEIADLIPSLNVHTKNSGLLHFLDPYREFILAASAILALVEISIGQRKLEAKEKKSKKNKH